MSRRISRGSLALLLSVSFLLGGCSLISGRGEETRFDPYPERVRGCPAASVRGMYRPGVVEQVAAEHLEALLACLPEDEVAPGPEGEVSFALIISRGDVCALRPLGATLEPAVVACLGDQVQAWTFPVLREDAEAYVRLRVELRQTARGPGVEVNEVRSLSR